MLSGDLPFVADGPGKVLGMHILTPPPLLKEVAPHVPPPLADLVQRLLVKDRDKRPSMAEVVSELTALGELHPLPRQASGPPSASESVVDPLRATGLQAPSTLGNAASQAAPRPRLKWRRMLALTVAGALALMALVLYVLVKTSPRFALTADRFQRGVHLMWHAADPEPAPSPAAPPPPAPTPTRHDSPTVALLGAREPVRDPPALPPRPGPPLPDLRLADAPGAVGGTSPGLSGSPGVPRPQPAPKPALKPPPKKSYVAKRPNGKWRGKHKFVRRRRR